MTQISDFYNHNFHFGSSFFSSGWVAYSWSVNRHAGPLNIVARSNHCNTYVLQRFDSTPCKTTLNISFLVGLFKYIYTRFCRIVAICYFESHLANSTNIVTIVFFFGPASSRFFQPPNVKLFHFLTQKIKTRNTPTDFVTKEELWSLLDNFDRQIFHSSVGFAYLIRVRNEENNRVLAGIPTKSFPGPFLWLGKKPWNLETKLQSSLLV